MDTASIAYGETFPDRIVSAIRGCSVMLVLIGPYWLQPVDGVRRIDEPDDWVRHRIEAGLQRREAMVIPVLLDGAAVPEASGLLATCCWLVTPNGGTWSLILNDPAAHSILGRTRAYKVSHHGSFNGTPSPFVDELLPHDAISLVSLCTDIWPSIPRLSLITALEIAQRRLPDDNGINIEGLAWDSARSELIFGIRSPTEPPHATLLRGISIPTRPGPWRPWTRVPWRICTVQHCRPQDS